jgi:hypothetical protein
MKSINKLEFHATPRNWNKFLIRKESSLYTEILQDNSIDFIKQCHYCSYKLTHSNVHLVNIDNDYSKTTSNNLRAACDLCSSVLFLDRYDTTYKGADQLIYFPSIPQYKLSHLYRSFHKYNQKNKIKAIELFSELKSYSGVLDGMTFQGLSNPGIFKHYLYTRNGDSLLINSIRWIPASISEEFSLFR